MVKKFETKDSGKRKEFSTGMQRDTQEDKPRFDLLSPLGVPYNEQLLTRWGLLMSRGAKKYNERNWEKAETQEELERAKASLLRHAFQLVFGEDDEDHATAILFNVALYENVKRKLQNEK